MEDGSLKVTGRLKEQYKLENGKYIVPTPIEEAIGMSRFISQVVLFGSNKPHNVALLVPDFVAVRADARARRSNDNRNWNSFTCRKRHHSPKCSSSLHEYAGKREGHDKKY